MAGKALIIYYSRKGQNYVNGTLQNLEKGNTEYVAEFCGTGCATEYMIGRKNCDDWGRIDS